MFGDHLCITHVSYWLVVYCTLQLLDHQHNLHSEVFLYSRSRIRINYRTRVHQNTYPVCCWCNVTHWGILFCYVLAHLCTVCIINGKLCSCCLAGSASKYKYSLRLTMLSQACRGLTHLVTVMYVLYPVVPSSY